MATLQDRSTSEMEQAVQEGFDLSGCSVLRTRFPALPMSWPTTPPSRRIRRA